MQIKYLTLHGWKPHPDKKTFAFKPGINIISGPNGSGKTRILEALDWLFCSNEETLETENSHRIKVTAEVTVKGNKLYVFSRELRGKRETFSIDNLRVKRSEYFSLLLSLGFDGNGEFLFNTKSGLENLARSGPSERFQFIWDCFGGPTPEINIRSEQLVKYYTEKISRTKKELRNLQNTSKYNDFDGIKHLLNLKVEDLSLIDLKIQAENHLIQLCKWWTAVRDLGVVNKEHLKLKCYIDHVNNKRSQLTYCNPQDRLYSSLRFKIMENDAFWQQLANGEAVSPEEYDFIKSRILSDIESVEGQLEVFKTINDIVELDEINKIDPKRVNEYFRRGMEKYRPWGATKHKVTKEYMTILEHCDCTGYYGPFIFCLGVNEHNIAPFIRMSPSVMYHHVVDTKTTAERIQQKYRAIDSNADNLIFLIIESSKSALTSPDCHEKIANFNEGIELRNKVTALSDFISIKDEKVNSLMTGLYSNVAVGGDVKVLKELYMVSHVPGLTTNGVHWVNNNGTQTESQFSVQPYVERMKVMKVLSKYYGLRKCFKVYQDKFEKKLEENGIFVDAAQLDETLQVNKKLLSILENCKSRPLQMKTTINRILHSVERSNVSLEDVSLSDEDIEKVCKLAKLTAKQKELRRLRGSQSAMLSFQRKNEAHLKECYPDFGEVMVSISRSGNDRLAVIQERRAKRLLDHEKEKAELLNEINQIWPNITSVSSVHQVFDDVNQYKLLGQELIQSINRLNDFISSFSNEPPILMKEYTDILQREFKHVYKQHFKRDGDLDIDFEDKTATVRNICYNAFMEPPDLLYSETEIDELNPKPPNISDLDLGAENEGSRPGSKRSLGGNQQEATLKKSRVKIEIAVSSFDSFSYSERYVTALCLVLAMQKIESHHLFLFDEPEGRLDGDSEEQLTICLKTLLLTCKHQYIITTHGDTLSSSDFHVIKT